MPSRKNQYAAGARRPERLPIVPVTHKEHDLVDEYCSVHHLSYAQAVRSGLVALGVLTPDTLYDLPRPFAELVLGLTHGGRAK
jgi:hypothetical protein